MNVIDIFDLAMLLVVVFFAVKGAFRGFFAELFSLIGVLGGIYLGLKYADAVSSFILRFLPAVNVVMARIAAIALVFFAVCIVCSIIGNVCTAILSFVSLSALDSMCGLVAGAAKGAAIVIAVVMLLVRMQSFLPGVELSQSRIVVLVDSFMPDIERYIDMIFPSQLV